MDLVIRPNRCVALTVVDSMGVGGAPDLPYEKGGRPDTSAVSATIKAWGLTHRRSLPWRTATTRYLIVVAEILLQKTVAETAVPVWTWVTTRYPTAPDLAVADPIELQSEVAVLGLGSQRVHRLISAANALVRGSDQVPGIARYGSGVVALATGDAGGPVPVDTNVARIVSRVWGLSFHRGEARKKPEISALTASMLAWAPSAADKLSLLYALVDLGALVCTSKKPSCSSCPLVDTCCWARNLSVPSSTRAISSASARPSGGGTASETSRI